MTPPIGNEATAAASGSLVDLKAELEGWSKAANRSGLTAVAGLFGLMGLHLLSRILTGRPFLVALSGIVAYLALLVWALRNRLRQDEALRERLKQDLERSGLIEKLALEGTPADRAVDHVPMPIRLFFPNLAFKKPTLRAELQMVGANLGWYLKPPVLLIKLGWFAGLGGMLLILVNSALVLLHLGHWIGQIQGNGDAPFYAEVLGGIPWMLMSQQEVISRGILADELLKRMRLGDKVRVTDPAARSAMGLPVLVAEPGLATLDPNASQAPSIIDQ